MIRTSDRAYDEVRMEKLRQEHEERIRMYSVNDRKQAFLRLQGSLSYLKERTPKDFG